MPERREPRSGLYVFTDLDVGQSGWAEANTENQLRLALTRPAPVIDRDLTAPPGSPEDLDCYIPAAGATGPWENFEGQLMVWDAAEDAWMAFEPATGWLAVIIDEARLAMFVEGSGWTAGADLDPA